MKIFYWNIRGLANNPSKNILKRLIISNKPDIILLAEPWLSFDKFPPNWFHRLGYKMFAFNTKQNNIPTLWCICSLSMDPSVIDSSDQQVSFSFSINNLRFGVSAIYASTCYRHRRQLWCELSSIEKSIRIPWCSIGDFNAIVGAHEYRGFSTPARTPMIEFLNWSDSENLVHLPTRGVQFIWSNRRSGRRLIEKRLDRAMCNHEWLDSCSSVSVSSLINHHSDHHPILMESILSEMLVPHQFKFLKMWTLHEDCKNVVASSWNQIFVGCPMFVLSQKLKYLKNNLKAWNKEVFGNVHELVAQAESHLNHIQSQLDTLGHTDTLLEQQKTAQINLEKELEKEETYWKEKANVKWHLEGDRNTKYFHNLAKLKAKTNKITTIRHGEQLISDPQLIAAHITNHFKTIFCTSSVLQDNRLVEETIPCLITESINNMLTLTPSKEEIHNAVFALNKDGAPGPDGFGAVFFQTYWHIVKGDVENAVLDFFINSWMMPDFNANTLILIPKTQNADTVSQYRPIALANFKYKIISKIMADRVATIMPTIISPEQKGFIQGRQIKDCIFLASEAINQLDKKSFGGNLAFKVDIAKAFDTIEWPFLLKVLGAFGFNEKFCN